MTFTVSGVLLCGLLLFIAIKFGGLRVTLALIAVAFGFFLATSSAAPTVNHLLATMSGWLHAR